MNAHVRRRALLAGAAALPFAGCTRTAPAAYGGGWVGANVERGHRFREATAPNAGALPAPAWQRRVGVLIVGAGVAGLAAARALAQRGVDDVHVVDIEDAAGGNSRGHRMSGMDCPLGAHYLPVPGEHATEVAELLEAFGLRRNVAGAPAYDERHLCHSPQERLHIDGRWVEGLLPPIAALPTNEQAATLAQYRQFALIVEQAMSMKSAFAIPTARSAWSPALDALDAVAFAPWLDAQGLGAPALRWYLDYCCRDDYGAGAAHVSAWAGVHYFASRHGFHVPGERTDGGLDRDALLTWPEGNGWLSRRLAEPLRERLHVGLIALRVTEGRSDVSVDLWNAPEQRAERWTAPQVIIALPLFIAARLLAAPPAALVQAAASMRYAPWLVGNLHIDKPLADHPGAELSWDNVIYAPGATAASSLGYVDAMHQSTRRLPGPTVLTAYWALGGDSPAQLAAQRQRLLSDPWSTWAQAVVADLARVHPDLPEKVTQVDLMRYGHAMSIPIPGLRSSAALRALAEPQRRVHFAHADLSGYSVFEEAMYHGVRAGRLASGV